MNWTRVVVGGLVAGLVTWVADFVQHGILLGETYKRFDTVFSQTEASPLKFAAISITVGILTALLFAKSRGSWSPGWKGGAAFGLYLGLAIFFSNFYFPLVIDGFPYHLAWCWGGIGVVDGVLGGAVLGALIPRSD